MPVPARFVNIWRAPKNAHIQSMISTKTENGESVTIVTLANGKVIQIKGPTVASYGPRGLIVKSLATTKNGPP